jgi:hypothetical protein
MFFFLISVKDVIILSILGQHIEIWWKKYQLFHMTGIDTDPDPAK